MKGLSLRKKLTKPISIIGMMGSGKSTVGRILARKLRLQFYDSDKEIENRLGLSVSDIYEFKGEDYFREKEAEAVQEILDYGIVLLSTGSNTFLNEDLRNLIKEKSISICLSADLQTIHSRVIRRNTRPEIDNISNKEEYLKEMLDERMPLYNQADIVVESRENDETHHVVDSLMSRLAKYLSAE